MRLSTHMQWFLKGLAAFLIGGALLFKCGPTLANLRWQLCELLPAEALASYGVASPQMLFDYSDAVIVGTVTSSQVRRAAPLPWSEEGCRIITVHDVIVEKIIAGHGPVSVPERIKMKVEGGEAWFGNSFTTGQPTLQKTETFVAFIHRTDYGRFEVSGGGLGKYRVQNDGSLGEGWEEKGLLKWVFKKDMTLSELEAYPFGRGIPGEDNRKPLFTTHEVRPGLSITIPSDMKFRSGDGTDGFESQSVEWGDGNWVGWKIPVYMICDRPDGDCDLGYMGRTATPQEVYAEHLKHFREREGWRDLGEYWQANCNGHSFDRGDGAGYEERVALCGNEVLLFTIPPMPPESRERVDQVLGSFKENP